MKTLQKIALIVAMICIEHINMCSYGSYTTQSYGNANSRLSSSNQEKFPGTGYRLGGSSSKQSSLADLDLNSDKNQASDQSNLSGKGRRASAIIDNSPEGHADRLFQQAFITPFLQAYTLLGTNHPYVIDTKTYMPVLYTVTANGNLQEIPQRAMPTIREIINQAEKLKRQNFAGQAKMLLENAAFALKIAEYTAALEAAYDKKMEVYYFSGSFGSEVVKILRNHLENIKALLENDDLKFVNSVVTSNIARESYEKIAINALKNKNHKLIPFADISTFIEHNTFSKDDSTAAANLLFKQCFIAQQALRKYENPDDMNQTEVDEVIQIHIQQTSRLNLNEFEAYPSFYDMIEYATHINPKTVRNLFYKHIRQAVQTALFIAKFESSSTFHRLFSSHYFSFDPVITQLRDMEKVAHLRCVDRSEGATIEDASSEEMWNNLTNIALGIGVVGGAVASLWAYNHPKEIQKGYNQYVAPTVNSVKNFIAPEDPWLTKQAKKIFTPKTNTQTPEKAPYKFGSAVSELGEHEARRNKDIIERNPTLGEYLTEYLSLPSSTAQNNVGAPAAQSKYSMMDFNSI